jgi:predicted RNA binding protein YcfA (HicA-like mRNA interferase family)
MKLREAIRDIERDGWFLVATCGSHRQLQARIEARRVTPANSILKQAGLKERK